ncbi:tRNA uridine-5-carboxymethylaminomethyl(34) synthesis enzyme MnmG [Aliarcobacter cryaerophilus]|uniref:tRNA uridine 5-carboxymethylaminomethyl modification enzyme MnmG n=2 Tax=unclassified Arcobacter TaxID=2593671 RepID=A0AA96DE23_9BACT|nr:tRNA uridine-5-carboxymethylaminomethyl(34) synthesis enzyme MnmG [Arcobacter sp. AZ-2023]WPD09047.1 tRNA uridine-5-carboxymethylaminomethyl(34) synthesis enzyme MnmG [Arcobacter sp. DSM 115954]WNL13879.1 tRNA uridine-5-carboxymethylaminomethyl(34) synthesis enzyme MnmG [Arcobacter sp. AZ-2023]WNL18115.1 tRNA uridine-5-carboxymethylaminomethyl(34) synthesis enzyme MnmG [Arcobacter sp. AZ-2023]WNL20250.1 tRNA uridine-5-carboxymethylaminomethyl(34) synthesis enzyme MnmG [Arcobacter sp. AZ-2023
MQYDIIVVGAGHAGIEAALAGARLGKKTLLITMLVEQIGAASCNPAIGGLAKGHLVRELDAIGGEMGLCTDATGIQFRILNDSKGAAVQGTRAQIDMDEYKEYMRKVCHNTANLDIYQDEVSYLIVENDEVLGVKTKLGEEFKSKKTILTTGTFMRGLIHIGENTYEAGRAWELPSTTLSIQLKELGLNVGRLKTGTPSRLDANSIDFSVMETHGGDIKPTPFSFRTPRKTFNPTQYPCYVTYTNLDTHEIISQNFHRAPIYTGQIQGSGPRYCPSIEDKVKRFSERERHQLFLEPQTAKCTEYYINGMSSSLPIEIQKKMIASVKGLENARVIRYGYAIEYDYVDPTELKQTLETKKIKNLYHAGQINATTGYEEAAAQGLMASINASLAIDNKEPFILRRDEAYIGVLIDDLVTKGTHEPYRMFTSRAEYRLLLREENADLRLSHYGYELGLISKEQIDKVEEKRKTLQQAVEFMANTWITAKKETLELLESIGEDKINDRVLLIDLIGRNTIDKEKFDVLVPSLKELDDYFKEQIIIEAKYYRYIQKQQKQIEKMKKMLKLNIPENFSYRGLPGLSNEVVEKLEKHRPPTLYNASLISGITPAALDIIHLNLNMFCHKQ